MSLLQDKWIPSYRGQEWLGGSLPERLEDWPSLSRGAAQSLGWTEATKDSVREYSAGKPWIFPDTAHHFLCDIHADTDAFFLSLVAAGTVERTGPNDADFRLTAAGKQATLVLGGDCLDKGPNNLRLLKAIRQVRDAGANLKLLAGNHDVRAFVGFSYAGQKDPRVAHLFIRMGKKSIPLFKEIRDTYLAGDLGSLPSDDEVRARLFPGEDWFEKFPEAVRGILAPARIRKELRRIREKIEEFQVCAREQDLSLGVISRAMDKARQLFMDPQGEFHWFFRDMELAYRAGSFLFVHAGVDDTVAELLAEGGVPLINRHFENLKRNDLFTLYHGPVGNVFRTKYREGDFPLSRWGVRALHRSGIYAIIHGHRNVLKGQRVVFRQGMLNFECDSSVDSGTRKLEGLEGPGGAATILSPDGRVVGISTDWPTVKAFQGSELFGTMAVV